eukprot:SAG22_NODE_15288_length_352_cov_0.920949_2_plen_22_part_01
MTHVVVETHELSCDTCVAQPVV